MDIISNIEHKKKVNTMRVEEVRLRFKLAQTFINPLNSLIQMGFRKKKKGSTALGNAMSYALHNAIEGEYPDIVVNPAEVRISEGSLASLFVVKIERNLDRISLIWECLQSLNAKRDDHVILCAYNDELAIAGINSEKVMRKDEELDLKLPSGMSDKPVHLYLMLHDRDKKSFSRSKYLGML